MEMTAKCPQCKDGKIEIEASWQPADRSVGIFYGDWEDMYAAPCNCCGYLMDDAATEKALNDKIESDNESAMVDAYEGQRQAEADEAQNSADYHNERAMSAITRGDW